MKNTKYYNLIIDKIKNHYKYNGLETILEDIANDVYEHSAIIIETIENEEVISAYIDKVISTSIITVPKKLNFNTRVRHRIISTLPDITTTSEPVINKSSFENSLNVTQDNSFLEIQEQNIQTSKALEKEELIIDKTLVDRMINGSSQSEQINNLSQIEQEVLVDEEPIEELEIEQEVLVDEGPIEELEIEQEVLVDEEPIEELETEQEVLVDEEPIEELEIEQDVLVDEEPIEELETEQEVLINEEPIEELEIEQEVLVDEGPIEELGIEQEVLVDEEPIEELETEQEVLVDEGPIEDLEIEQEILVDEEPIEELEIEQENECQHEHFAQPDFSCFNYTPKTTEIMMDEYQNELLALQKTYSNIDIDKLCKLKFIENEEIENIANYFNTSKENIFEALSDIIDRLKD